MKIGSFEVPFFRLIPNAKQILEEIYKVKHRDRMLSKDLAILLGHKYGTETHFYRKLRSLTAYGLLEGKGNYQVSELGEKLLHPKNDFERESAKTESVLNVGLWKEIYKKHGKKPREDNFWAVLVDITKIEPDRAKEIQSQVFKWYIEDISYVSDQMVGMEGKPDPQMETQHLRSLDAEYQQLSQQTMPPTVVGIQPSEVRTIQFGQVALTLPKKDLKKEWEKLQKHMEIFLDDYEPEETTTIDKPPESDIKKEANEE